MLILQNHAVVCLYAAALLLTGGGCAQVRLRALAYVGGACWAAGTLGALYVGAPLREILLVTLLLLLVSQVRVGKERRK